MIGIGGTLLFLQGGLMMMKKEILISMLSIIIFYNIGYADVDFIRNIEASSSIKGYPAKYAIDNNVNTTWACKNKKHQWIKINFRKTVQLYGIYIASGYLKNERVYKNNNRLKKIKILHNNQEIMLDNFEDYNISLEDYVRFHIDGYSQSLMQDAVVAGSVAEYEDVKEKHKNYLKYITDNTTPSFFYPVIFKNPIKCDSIKILICDTYIGDRYNEICISEIYPIIKNEKYSNPNLDELRDIGFIFEKLQNNDKSILLSNGSTIKNIQRSYKGNAEKGVEDCIEIKGELKEVDLYKISIDKAQPVRYMIDSKHKHLILWNGKSGSPYDGGVSDFPMLFLKKINNNWKILAVSDVSLYTIHDIMPHFRNEMLETLMSVFREIEPYPY